jgi:hypothetical protein
VSRSAKPHYRNKRDTSVSGGEQDTPAADEFQASGVDERLLLHCPQSESRCHTRPADHPDREKKLSTLSGSAS